MLQKCLVLFLSVLGKKRINLPLHRTNGTDEGAHGVFLGVAAGRVMLRMMDAASAVWRQFFWIFGAVPIFCFLPAVNI